MVIGGGKNEDKMAFRVKREEKESKTSRQGALKVY
jgi:hypothetical protein